MFTPFVLAACPQLFDPPHTPVLQPKDNCCIWFPTVSKGRTEQLPPGPTLPEAFPAGWTINSVADVIVFTSYNLSSKSEFEYPVPPGKLTFSNSTISPTESLFVEVVVIVTELEPETVVKVLNANSSIVAGYPLVL